MTDTQLNSFRDFISWENGTRDTIDVKCVYIDMAQGKHIAGILLSQIVYWHLPSKANNKTRLRVRRDGHLWLAKGRDDWYDEIRLSPRQFDKASKQLVDLGLIEKKVYKFAGAPTVHIRLRKENFINLLRHHMEAKFREDMDAEETMVQEEGVTTSEYLEEENPISPNGENHIQRENNGFSSSNEDKKPMSFDKCSLCKKRPAVSKALDEHGRCATCLFVDAWEHYVKVRTPAYSTKEDEDGNEIREYVGLSSTSTIQAKMVARLKEPIFRQGWVFALNRAGRMEHLVSGSWFKPEYFLRNSENWKKIVDGTFDSFEEQNHPVSYAMLAKWLARRNAGVVE